ncbi:hypothetical protein [Nesterenkonia haasae]|uniref:hypothetical protein n=1 Tax=Nesterenkonia haasae TaxID=2587813 RepID=UPI001390D661|nr:hypothetical protein [Nesterenkonia haasae]NDK31728.1 hypothetical protein [Nesterenkonia haasae]
MVTHAGQRQPIFEHCLTTSARQTAMSIGTEAVKEPALLIVGTPTPPTLGAGLNFSRPNGRAHAGLHGVELAGKTYFRDLRQEQEESKISIVKGILLATLNL